MKKIFISTVFILSSTTSLAQNVVQNLQTAAVLDVLAPIHFESSENNKIDIRSTELIFFGPLDTTFDGTLNFAAHNEDGEMKPEVHEAYLSSSKLIPSSRIKAGKFFLGVGRLNQFHQHDWAFTSTPRVQKDFFAEEAVIDTGIEYSILLPFESYWDLTVGVTNGYTYGHGDQVGAKPHVPTHYIHPVNFVDFGEAGALQWGANYLGRTDSVGVQTQLYGFDFVFKKYDGKTLSFLLQSEIWYRKLSGLATETTEDLGAYIYPQFSLDDRLSLGLRIDLFKELSKVSASDGSKQENFNFALVPNLTYRHSEFTLFRMSYSYDHQGNAGLADTINQQILLQMTLFLGAHPTHSF